MPNGIELRCPSKLHGMLLDGNIIEFKCDSRFCGAGPGWTVLHKIDRNTGEPISTERFKNPPTPQERKAR